MTLNTTSNSTTDCPVANNDLYKFYAAVMIVIFILALPLNTSVLHLFIFKLKFWKSNSNNIFLFNLVLADILLLICLPIKAHNFIDGNRRSQEDVICKAMLFMLFLNRGASIAFLTVTSVDRYYNVVHPGRKNLLKALKKSPYISIFIWVLLLPLTIPTMLRGFDCCNSLDNDNTNNTENKISWREVRLLSCLHPQCEMGKTQKMWFIKDLWNLTLKLFCSQFTSFVGKRVTANDNKF